MDSTGDRGPGAGEVGGEDGVDDTLDLPGLAEVGPRAGAVGIGNALDEVADLDRLLVVEPDLMAGGRDEAGEVRMGRPGEAAVEVLGPRDDVDLVKVGGPAVTVMRAEIGTDA